MPLWLLMAGSMGLNFLENRKKEQNAIAQQKLDANLMEYAPWTGQKVSPKVRDTETPMASLLGGALQGASIYNAFQDADLDQTMKDKLLGGEAQTIAENAKMSAPPVPGWGGENDGNRGEKFGGYLMAAERPMQDSSQLAGGELLPGWGGENEGSRGSSVGGFLMDGDVQEGNQAGGSIYSKMAAKKAAAPKARAKAVAVNEPAWKSRGATVGW